MNEKDKHFIKRYEELLDKGYCDCNEMNCIDNNSPRRILNIVKDLQKQNKAYENMRKDLLDLILYQYPALSQSESDFKDDLLNILNKVGGSDE